ncbi:outer membrane protein assembly factor BamE [Tabrizicola sp.]|uniref:outer membrane protein assembly factor BamE n=1 Tax=Tabrizicola sp. TaxID=2005166 RepID=UPI0025F6E829|nr:outer membrane protein assembly factor BamE [Tabrizicola sp.]
MADFRMARSVLSTSRAARKGWLMLALVASVAACSPVIRNHGYVPTEQELALVEIGTDTRETVGEKIGRPTTSGLLNDVGWFYVQSQYRHFGPRAPQEIQRQVLAVTFNEAGTVENIASYGLDDGKVVQISRRVTEPNVKGLSFIQQLLGSFGRLQAGDLLGE